jgi:metal-responsive CopG/Arc/MetJ family transcriptional regulator
MVALRLPKEMIEGLERLAADGGVSRSKLIRDLIAERLDAPKSKAKR